MTNYAELLTKEEKTILCGIITGRKFKEHFKANEKEFSKIQKGFRAKALTEQFALSIAVSNVDKPFITKFVDAWVVTWLEQIQENIKKLEGEGLTHGIALASTMLDSVFADNVDLYLKLTGAALDAEAHARLFERMDCIRSERVRNDEVAERIKTLKEENHHLSEQIEAAQQAAAAAKEEHEQIIQEVEQKKAALAASLTEAQEKIKELQTAPSAFKSNDTERLASFDDTDQNWLIRHADLSHNGHYHVFQKNDDAPPYFANRDKIFYKDGPSNAGFYGVWTWSAVPNENDPSKDYILSQYSTKLDAIEVVIITEASSLDVLIKLLKDGIECQFHSRRVMFSIYASKGYYTGILCNAKELITANGKAAFAEDCNVVPVYEFAGDDILRLDNC